MAAATIAAQGTLGTEDEICASAILTNLNYWL